MILIDSLLNRVTMYRLVVYGLSFIAVVGVMLASIGRLSMTPSSMVISLGALLFFCFLSEYIYSKIWRMPFNSESWLITALIVFLIFPAPKHPIDLIVIAVVAMVSSASKYIFSWKGKHIFNPAALAVGLVGLLNIQVATWWVGSSALWPFTLLFGLFVVRKIRRFTLVLTFVITSIIIQGVLFIHDGAPFLSSMQATLIASPLIFLSTIMLTEPATMPPRRNQQLVFGFGIAILYSFAWKLGPIVVYPEIALLIGNIYAFTVAPKFKMRLRLKEIQKISDQIYNFVLIPDKKIRFTAGELMEWTLPGVDFDSRGNRRSLTIASSPTEDTVQLGVKFYNPSSTFKYTMSRMKPGDPIYASQLAGNFTIKGNEREKMVFVAGGIGITPFRSIIKNIIDEQKTVDVTLLYAVGKSEEFAYLNDFLQAHHYGVTVIKVVTGSGESNQDGIVHEKLSNDLIAKLVPDYSERLFYISGPNHMVDATKECLKLLAIPKRAIKTDHFSGY